MAAPYGAVRNDRPERAQRFACHRRQKPPARQSDGQQSPKQQNRVDTGPALALPIYVFKIEPEREFIQGQSGADAVQE